MFANFSTVVTNDRFYLRVGGTRDSATVRVTRSGWVCHSGSTCYVQWAVDPPLEAVLWTAVSVNTLTLTCLTENNQALQFIDNPQNGQPVLLGTQTSTSWLLSRFSGYSDNSVPGYGYEENGFFLKDTRGNTLGVSSSQDQTLVYDDVNPTGFNLLYFTGPRDSLEDGNIVCRIFTSSNKWLGLSQLAGFTTQRRVVLVENEEDAVVCRVRGFAEQNGVARFAVGIVASEWTLSTNVDKQLVWGEPSVSANVTLLSIISPVLETGTLSSWTIQLGSSQYVIDSSLTLNQNVPPLTFGFAVVPSARLFLQFSGVLQENVTIMDPATLIPEAKLEEPFTPAEPVYVTGRSASAGCTTLLPYIVNSLKWYPEFRPVIPFSYSEVEVTWTSGNSEGSLPNKYYLSAQDGIQTRPTTLRVLPMANGAMCFVDGDSVPPLCGALQPNFLNSNINALPTSVATKFNPAPNCGFYFKANLQSSVDQGYSWLFGSTDCSFAENNLTTGYVRLASTQFLPSFSLEIKSAVVPENLFLLVQEVSSGRQLRLPSGTYTQNSFHAINALWPSGVVTFWAFCCTAAPDSFYIARLCNGFPGSETERWLPGKSDCNAFMAAACTTGTLTTSNVCGCYQDIADIQSSGLGQVAADMIKAPQCWGTRCGLGSAYLEEDWTHDCGPICSQIIQGYGDNFFQSGTQTLTCGGDVYNLPAPEVPVPTKTSSTSVGWYVGLAGLSVLGVVFVVLFALEVRKKKPNRNKEF